jgi:hypothetical protein
VFYDGGESVTVQLTTGTGYTMIRRYDDTLPGWDSMKGGDQFFVADFDGDMNEDDAADFDGDEKDDLYVFNADGVSWSYGHLLMLQNTGTELKDVKRYDATVDEWGVMWSEDKWHVADVDGDGLDDLYVFNGLDWPKKYLGMLRSSGKDLSGSMVASGSMVEDEFDLELKETDRLQVIDFYGSASFEDLVIYSEDRLGLVYSMENSLGVLSVFPGWIHHHAYHDQGWW